MYFHVPDPIDPALQRLSVSLARIGESHPYVGPTDPDTVLNDLIVPSFMAQPLLLSGRSLLDAGTGIGLPGLPLSLSSPARPTILVEPRTRCIGLIHWLLEELPTLSLQLLNHRLETVNFHRLPPVQLVTRAALDWTQLSDNLPESTAPLIRWSGPNVPPPPKRPGWIRRSIRVIWNDHQQAFYWWGPEELFHVKQSHWSSAPSPPWTLRVESIDRDR